jgi:hypothetical protein
MARLAVTVKPGSKRPGLTIAGEAIELRIRERAIEGAANSACIEALAALLRVARSSVALLRGARSRHKLFGIDGMTGVQALRRIADASGDDVIDTREGSLSSVSTNLQPR